MILQAFAVFDKKIEAFDKPMWFRSRGEAIRAFSDAVQDDKSPFANHPEDFAFAYICQFDDSNGLVQYPSAGPTFVIQALDCIREPQ